MPIKLNDPNKLVNKRLKRSDVKNMVQSHRNTAAAKKLHYSHFPLTEVLALFRDNGVIDFTKPLDSQLTAIKNFGVKIYPGYHYDETTCAGHTDYVNHSNVIICNTAKASGSAIFKDMLDDTKHFISMAGFNEGLDMGQICPPECGTGTDDVA